MAIHLTNTLSGKKEVFVPLIPGKVGIYYCGPTVYGLTHVGNARPAVFFDAVRRFFEFRSFKVTFVSNFTDVDDKIIARARAENSTSQEIAEKFTREFIIDLERLGVRTPDFTPKVTEHIGEIIKLVERLVAIGAAYVTAEGEVLYSVRGFSEYGKLSKKRLDDLKTAVRIEANDKKRDPLDFALWKPQKAADEPAWESPWGKGRPGWHIECSAMAAKYLGASFDIHGGGLDLVHPHHENEIAQSERATGKPLASYWLHNNMVTIGDEKMSKSLGNIFLTREFVDRYSSEVLRFLLLSSHYRSTIDFSISHISDCRAALHRFYSCLERVQAIQSSTADSSSNKELDALEKFSNDFESNWTAAMEDDFNTAKVIGLVFEYVRLANGVFDAKGFRSSSRAAAVARRFAEHLSSLGQVINLFQESPRPFLNDMRKRIALERGVNPIEIEELLTKRADARRNKDFATSDAIRTELGRREIEIRDSAMGSEWDFVTQKA